MDLELLSKLLRELVSDNDRVALPGIGTFLADITPAFFSPDGKTINPPNRRILFKSSDVEDDGVLSRYYIDKFSLSVTEAKAELDRFFQQMSADLNKGSILWLPGFGALKKTAEGPVVFSPDNGLNIYADAFGLEPIAVKPVDALSTPETSVRRGRKERREKKAAKERAPRPRTAAPLARPAASKKQRNVIILLSVIITLLLLILLFVVFKDQIYELFEGMLYSEEEMELIKSFS